MKKEEYAQMEPKNHVIEDELYPSIYYQTPTFLSAKNYVALLEIIKEEGYYTDWIDKVINLFLNLKEGHEQAYDLINAFAKATNTRNKTKRMWLAWRVIYQAIEYFSRFWRTDNHLIEYFEEYEKFIEKEGQGHSSHV